MTRLAISTRPLKKWVPTVAAARKRVPQMEPAARRSKVRIRNMRLHNWGAVLSSKWLFMPMGESAQIARPAAAARQELIRHSRAAILKPVKMCPVTIHQTKRSGQLRGRALVAASIRWERG